MGERRGTKGLELWCRRMTDGYPGVNVVNMTTSWRDGLAFCAIIHHFRPDLIEFSKLNKDDIYYNNELAFRIAERHLGIPALLEPEDMVEFPVPDRLSILTYLSQFYQTFVVAQGSSPSRIAPKRPATSPDHGIVSPASTSPPTKVSFQGAGKIRREPCAKCGLPVFIAERLNVGKLLYHRTCFRCARCNSQLTLANYYETENNEFCCETCPDEEKLLLIEESTTTTTTSSNQDKNVLTRSLSDEEKSANIKKFDETTDDDDYSAKFETALEYPDDSSLKRNSTLNNVQSNEFLKARTFFINSQMEDDDESNNSDSGNEDEPPDLPNTKPPNKIDLLGNNENASLNDSSVILSAHFDSGFPSNRLEAIVNIDNSNISLSNATSIELEKSHNIVTKDIISAAKGDNDENNISLVKARMRLFENKLEIVETSKSDVANELPQQQQQQQYINRNINNNNNNNNVPFNHQITSSVNKEFVNKTDSLIDNNRFESPKEHSSKDNILDDKNKVEDLKEKSPRISDFNIRKDETPSNEPIEKFVDNTSSVGEKKPDFEETDKPQTLSTELLDDDNNKLKDAKEVSSVPVNSLLLLLLKENEQTKVITVENEVKEEKTRQDDVSNKIPPSIEISKNEDHIINSDLPKVNDDDDNNKVKEDYPEDLNPFGDDEEEQLNKNVESNNQKSLNPFDEDDEDKDKILTPSPKPAVRRKMKSTEAKTKQIVGLNPFGDDDDDDDSSEEVSKIPPPQPAVRTPLARKIIVAPRISLNPFWSDDDDNDEGKDGNGGDRPVPKPRMSKTSPSIPEVRPRDSGLSLNTSVNSESSLSSTGTIHSLKKKKPAPKPPSVMSSSVGDITESEHSSLTSSPCHSMPHSPRLTPKVRKIRKAPLPPPPPPPPTIASMTSQKEQEISSPISQTDDIQTIAIIEDDFEKEKIAKDEMNRNRQSQNMNLQSPTSSESSSLGAPNKSTYGKWKRRKGQAPSRPIPQRRTIKSLPMGEVRRELELIEIQQQGLEKQGVRLEQIIRDKCEGPDANTDELLSPDVEDLILQLFELVNEKNELFRKQAELMYLRRQQRLEEEHADVEYQIRCLMLQPEANKTDSDKAREEELINRLVDIVERRNEIIECLEMDRVREAEEDDSINNQLNLYTLKKDEKTMDYRKKDKKKHKKEKKFKIKGHKVDIDKDVDESETSTSTLKGKEKKKKKFNIF